MHGHFLTQFLWSDHIILLCCHFAAAFVQKCILFTVRGDGITANPIVGNVVMAVSVFHNA